MQDYHGYNTFVSGVLMFGILQGVCVLDDQDIVRTTGSSLDFLLEHLNETVSFAEWKFNGNIFAEYESYHYTFPPSQFSGRLEENHHKIGVTIKNLQPQDSGTFSVVTLTSKQLPTKIFKVYIKDPITAVRIETTQTWKVSTNSCDVDVKCAALRPESVSYLWSGYKNGSGAQLQFSLSPADGAVTLKCTAANNLNNITAIETLSCSAEQIETGVVKPEWIIPVAGGAAVLLVIAVIISVSCWWKSHKADGSDPEGTVYADVNPGAVTQKNTRSDSVTNGMTVYETVDDLRMAPEMTIYAKVTLPQHTKVSSNPSSPYQQVL